MKIVPTRQSAPPSPEKNVSGTVSFRKDGLWIKLSYPPQPPQNPSLLKVKAIPAFMTPLQLN